MRSQGIVVTAYVGAELDPQFKTPVGADRIVKTWCANRSQAGKVKANYQQTFDDAVVEFQ